MVYRLTRCCCWLFASSSLCCNARANASSCSSCLRRSASDLQPVNHISYKIHNTSTAAYLSHHIRPRKSTRRLRSAAMIPLIHRPTTRTHFADRAFRCSAPAVWNSLNTDTYVLALWLHSSVSLKLLSNIRAPLLVSIQHL